ncbi:Mth938-like domain-containing protein [Ottowia sp.]|uniref:Mth938-like domain-containing protein n=1 Tax=Ottowia sp. TaxID=1898956 RepID=UPI003A863B7C
MKFQPDKFGAAVTGYGPGWIEVAGQRIQHSLVLHSDGQRQAWRPNRFEDLSAADFALLAQHQPELVLFGSGERLRFPKPACLRPLIDARIGFETMDTPAACRTYNILAGEGRRVLVALLIGPDSPPPG